MKINYCPCTYPNLLHFQDTNGGRMTAVVFCDGCQRIVSEIFMEEEE
jgi:hypothetical protein